MQAARIFLLGCMLWAVLASEVASARTWYVNRAATGTETGRSWKNAATIIQDAIDSASSGDEIWIAQGTYDERRGTRGALFLKKGLSLYGGFRGEETDRDARDCQAHPTIIDGSRANNSFPASHTLVGAQDILLDGLTICGGRTDRQEINGGGLLQQGAAILRHCTFCDNSALGDGGAIYADPCTLELTDCVFRGNLCRGQNGGGAVCVNRAVIQATGCLFEDNTAGGDGGAVSVLSGSAIWRQCSFIRNNVLDGYGILFSYNTDTTLTNVLFSNNTGLGGTLRMKNGVLSAFNCCWYGNHNRFAAAVVNVDGEATLANSVLWDNTAAQIMGSVSVSYSIVQGGWPGDHNRDVEPLLFDPEQDDCRPMEGSPCIDTGTPVGAPLVDMHGVHRPAGRGIDIGPFEGAATGIVSFSAYPAVGGKPLAVSFASTLAPGLQRKATLAWDFGDGTTSQAANPIHVYDDEGLYDVSLVVTTPTSSHAATIPSCVRVYPEMPAGEIAAHLAATILLLLAAMQRIHPRKRHP